eukprot:gnl/TRDRNA2_/TRDRNA2_85072_c0_seq1.p1 gnl/TRDRNA2_/TRDRNA2_85072_c0~~gnl/TRDRNA2_/TRDRNA2_85072_c0_seq1.p1  ORF type:complete len:411 (-),score=54.14 gnl/TRDRNA2_/TRDRNA2_85072_c0_seq1:74-1189(-)
MPAVILRCPGARYLVIYYHSNGEDLGLCYSFGCGLRMVLEVHVLIVEYPGYGISPGKCSEDALMQVADVAYRFVSDVLRWPAEDIIVMGRSLGAALATSVASSQTCHGLILVAPFTSLVEAVGNYIGKLAPMLIGDTFANSRHIRKVQVPTLIVHGLDDRLVPCSQGQELHDLCPHKKKLFVCPDSMNHNSDLLGNAEYLIRPMLRFFALPDYAFVELNVPPEAFDKRHCHSYHKLTELAKDDAPLKKANGDQEPSPEWTTLHGPQGSGHISQASWGDMDDLDECNDFTVKTPRGVEPQPPSSSGYSDDTMVPSSGPSVARRTDSSSCDNQAAADHAEQHPESFQVLDIDAGISRFLHEHREANDICEARQ